MTGFSFFLGQRLVRNFTLDLVGGENDKENKGPWNVMFILYLLPHH